MSRCIDGLCLRLVSFRERRPRGASWTEWRARMPLDRELTEEEADLVAAWTRSSWSQATDPYRARDLTQIVDGYAPDAISMPAGHPAMRGQEEIRDWYARRVG